jgi:predicted nuclease of restriction endonuclease-like (RecB) superfamily
MSAELTLYQELLSDIKVRVRRAQHKAALSVNAEMILLYWDIGRMIQARQEREGWGAGVIPRLAVDLKNELPEEKGFSERNLKYMIRFAREYPPQAIVQQPVAPLQIAEDQATAMVPQRLALSESATMLPIVQHSVAQIPWGQNIILMERIKDIPTRLWYARQTLEHGWSREVLAAQIKSRAHERQGGAVTNFATTLPGVHASIAQHLLKDPYIFDFLTLEEPFHERELETGLLIHIQKFLLELGRGFAFVGRQYRLEVSDREFHLDLLFYHLHLRCFIVVDLKKGDFKPEHAGKMNFYCSVVDAQLRHPGDAPTLGLILCQTKDRILAEYSLKDIHKPIGVADYELTRALPSEFTSSLPSIEAIEAELSREPGPEAQP